MSMEAYVERELEGGSWSLNDDDTWSATWTVHISVYGALGAKVAEETFADPFGTGTYVRTDNELLFTSSSGQSYSGSVSGPELTVILDGGVPAVYRK